MQGVTAQVSDMKISTTCTKSLKNKLETRKTIPSLLMMRAILLQTALAWDKLLTTSGQSLSVAKITCHMYLKEVTISRGRP